MGDSWIARAYAMIRPTPTRYVPIDFVLVGLLFNVAFHFLQWFGLEFTPSGPMHEFGHTTTAHAIGWLALVLALANLLRFRFQMPWSMNLAIVTLSAALLLGGVAVAMARNDFAFGAITYSFVFVLTFWRAWSMRDGVSG